MSTSMSATLVAFFALGFFAATLLTVFRFLAIALPAALGVSVIGMMQGMPLLHGVGFGCGSFVLAQLGFGIGLAWMATARSGCVPD